MIGLVVRFDVRDEAAANLFDELTAETVARITVSEPGTLIYATHAVEGESLARVFYEAYVDEAAFTAHEQADHVVAFHSRKAPLLVGEPRVEHLLLGAGKGGYLDQ